MSLQKLFSGWLLARENSFFFFSFQEYVRTYGSFDEVSQMNKLKDKQMRLV